MFVRSWVREVRYSTLVYKYIKWSLDFYQKFKNQIWSSDCFPFHDDYDKVSLNSCYLKN